MVDAHGFSWIFMDFHELMRNSDLKTDSMGTRWGFDHVLGTFFFGIPNAINRPGDDGYHPCMVILGRVFGSTTLIKWDLVRNNAI